MRCIVWSPEVIFDSSVEGSQGRPGGADTKCDRRVAKLAREVRRAHVVLNLSVQVADMTAAMYKCGIRDSCMVSYTKYRRFIGAQSMVVAYVTDVSKLHRRRTPISFVVKAVRPTIVHTVVHWLWVVVPRHLDIHPPLANRSLPRYNRTRTVRVC